MKLQDVHQILSMFAPQTVTFETLTVNLFQVDNWHVRNKENNNYKIYSFSHGLMESGCCIWKVTTIFKDPFFTESWLWQHFHGNKLFFKQLVVGNVMTDDLSRPLPLGKNPHALSNPVGPDRSKTPPKNQTAKEKTTWKSWEVWKMLGFEFSSPAAPPTASSSIHPRIGKIRQKPCLAQRF